ncbi:MAG: serine endoprotease DegQ, partial [bacterium]|nr:serine endoprotease DegQ [bacterium]
MYNARRCLVGALVLVVGATFPAPPADAVLPLTEEGFPTLAPLIEDVTPAVVNVSVLSSAPTRLNPLFQDPFFRHFFDIPEEPPTQQRASAGSGVVVDAGDGYVLTNAHVIRGADEVFVTLKDGRRLDADIVGSDPQTDIAVLRVEPVGLTALELGDSDQVRVGDFVVAIGNPFG